MFCCALYYKGVIVIVASYYLFNTMSEDKKVFAKKMLDRRGRQFLGILALMRKKIRHY